MTVQAIRKGGLYSFMARWFKFPVNAFASFWSHPVHTHRGFHVILLCKWTSTTGLVSLQPLQG